MKFPERLPDYRPHRSRRLLMACFLLGVLTTYAQTNNPKQQADHFFYAQAYPKAAESYSELLKDNALPDEAKKDVLYNLGYSYQQLGDYAKAESYFRTLLELGEPTGKNQTAYLYYAQALGYNCLLYTSRCV